MTCGSIVLRLSSSSENPPSNFLVTSDNTDETKPKKSPPLARSSLDLIDMIVNRKVSRCVRNGS